MPGETEVLIVFTVNYFKCRNRNSIIHMAFVNHNFIVQEGLGVCVCVCVCVYVCVFVSHSILCDSL